MITNVFNYLQAAVQKYPDHIAVIDETESLTYRELYCCAISIGTALREHVQHRDPVGIFMDKDIHTLCSFWGTVSVGGFYSVLNPELPDQRLHQIANVLQPKLILTNRALADRAKQIFSGLPVCLVEDLLLTVPNEEAILEAVQESIDTDPLYVNFTSGSTGIPKGIAVCHRSVIDFISCFTELFHITHEDVIANQAPFDFDVSVKDIYSAVQTGCTLVIVPRRLFSAPAALIDFLCEHRVTTMIWAVSALCLITAFHALEYKVPETVNKILFSGEVMPYKALCNFKKYLPNATYVNLYGPTEITCNCTYHILSTERDYSSGIPVGVPFPNEDVFLLDEEDHLIRVQDKIGEICVRGTALALGYYSSPEQNALHFVQNPLNTHYPELIYRTGDLAKYNSEGELLFAGRKDFQIKYLGHRIELEEVEREMAAIEGVERCCCIFDEKRSRLKGYYIGSSEPAELHSAMESSLPSFMVPGILRRVTEFPLTKNGKIDRRLLAESTGKI